MSTFLLSSLFLFFALIGWTESDDLGSRSRRATFQGQVIVVSSSVTGPLLTLQAFTNDPQASYQLLGQAPNGLTLDPTGVVSRVGGYSWNTTRDVVIEFSVNVTSVNNGQNVLPVRLIIRDDSVPLFTNRPQPMWTTSKVWIRPDTSLYQLNARAAQDGATVVYKLESGGEGLFEVDSTTGVVRVKQRQQYEIGKVYTLGVSAQCVGVAISQTTPTQPLYIQIGEKAPQIDKLSLNISFTDDNNSGTQINTVIAKSFQNLALTYGMTAVYPTPASQTQSLFSLDPNSGALILRAQRNYFTDPRMYIFNVNLQEQYTNLKSSDTVYVNSGLAEGSPVGTSVLQVQAFDRDPDELGQLTYTVSNPAFTAVSLPNGGGATIQVNGELNYEFLNSQRRYEFIVTATDQGVPPLSATASVQVYIINSNNRAPVFDPSEQTVLIKEGASSGLAIHYIQAYDPDGDKISFQLDGSTDFQASQYFRVSTDGVVTLAQNMPRFPGSGSVPTFNLSIVATDDGSCCPSTPGPTHTTRASVIVKIQRINTQPVFADCATYRPSINEGANVGTTVLTMTATDNDSDENGRLSFSIVNIEGYSPFEVVPQSDGRSVVLRSTVVFNRENPPPQMTFYRFNQTVKYPVTVKVQDAGRTPLATNCFMLVTINDINDNSPVFDYSDLSDYTTNILSTGPQNDRVMRVYAVDTDSGANGMVSYQMSSTGVCSDNFRVDSQSGWITRARSSLSGNVGSVITCTVSAVDGGSPPRSTSTTITLNVVSQSQNLLPIWQPVNGTLGAIDDFQYSLDENVAVNSLLPLGLTAQSQRAGNPQDVGYYLTSSIVPELNSNGDFELNSNVLRVANRLDASAVNAYTLRIRAFSPASASTGLASIARLRVGVRDVNDKRPQFLGMDSNGIYPAAVSEYTQAGERVIYVTAIDQDRDYPNNLVTYSFAGSCSDCSSFQIDSVSGLISTRWGNFSRERQAQYVLTVQATDGAQSAIPGVNGPNVVTRTVSVQVNGVSTQPPYFSQPSYSYSIASNPPFNTTLFNQSATDPDTDNSYQHVLQYGIESGNDGRRFAVDSQTGRVYNVREIIYDPAKSSYTLTYRVFDGGVVSRTQLLVTVNQGPPGSATSPIFNQTFYNSQTNVVEKDSNSVGAQLAKVGASMPGGGGTVRYSVLDTDHFQVDPNSGVVTLTQSLDRDYPGGFPTWQTNVLATDTSGGGVGYAVVSITPQDINDKSPMFHPCCLIGQVNELAQPGTLALQLRATDADAGQNAQVSYSLVPGQSGSVFDVSPGGAVTLRSGASLNFDQTKSYDINVRGTDGGSSPRSTDQMVRIWVTQGNRNPPQFVSKQYSGTVDEELATGTSVISVYATDSDSSGLLSFSFVGTQPDYFYIDSVASTNSGVIKVKQRMDYEKLGAQTYTLTVRVVDPDPSHTDTCTVTLTLKDINDNAPVFSLPSISLNLSESLSVGSPVTRVSATDADAGDTQKIRYSIDYENTDRDQKFKVDSQSGAVTIRNPLSYDIQASYAVNILASDMGTATLFVRVINAGGSPLRLAPPPVTSQTPPSVSSSTRQGDQVYCFQAQDPGNNNVSIDFLYDGVCTAKGCSDFTLSKKNDTSACLVAQRNSGYTRSSVGLNAYNLTVGLRDSSDPASQPSLVNLQPITVKASNDRAPRDASKTVYVYNYERPNTGLYDTLPLGPVYVDDDDDDLFTKQFSLQANQPSGFSVTSQGQLVMQGDVGPGQYTVKVTVVDSKFSGQSATGTVNVMVNVVNDTSIRSAASIRLAGFSGAGELLSPVPNTRLSILQQQISALLNTQPINVDILSITQVTGSNPPLVDVLYTAHGSPYYSPEKLNQLVLTNRDKIGAALGGGVSIVQAPVDLCSEEFRYCYRDGCSTRVLIGPQPRLLNTNQVSLVGVDSAFVQDCSCSSLVAQNRISTVAACTETSCLNGGKCQQNASDAIMCMCPAGYNGPRCEKLVVSFAGRGYAQYRALEGCERDHISLEIRASAPDGIILYNGPTTNNPPSGTPQDFLSIELVGGKIKIRLNLGDGEVTLPSADQVNKFSRVDDNQWHTIEIFHVDQSVRLVIDYCNSFPASETISSTTQDRSSCESVATTPGEKILLSVTTPVQLGGRADADTLTTPSGLTKTSLTGCIRNLRQNGQLYDLALDSSQLWTAASDVCDSCPTCDSAAPVCTAKDSSSCSACNTGLTGAKCDQQAAVRMLGSYPALLRWTVNPGSVDLFNSSLSQMNNIVDLLFRTLQSDGTLFFTESFSTLERIVLELVGGRIRFRYDLGDGDRVLSLDQIQVNDGKWHHVLVQRHSTQVSLTLDAGGGGRYAELFEPFKQIPDGQHKLMRPTVQLMSGGIARLNPYTNQWDITSPLNNTCISDVRFAGVSLPLIGSDNHVTVSDTGVQNTCENLGVCGSSAAPRCGGDQWCDQWSPAQPCSCLDPLMVLVGGVCKPRGSCNPTPCVRGACVVIQGLAECVCPQGWSGPLCDGGGGTTDATTGGGGSDNLALKIALPVVLGIVLLALLAMLLAVCLRRRKDDKLLLEPDQDIRETIGYYDEEGAGEEDIYAYDLSRLQKPLDAELDSVAKPGDTMLRYGQLSGAAPEDLPDRARRRVVGGDYGDVGDYISDRLKQADGEGLNLDSLHEFDDEGRDSDAESLSSIESGGSEGEGFDYLGDWGPEFKTLDDLYNNDGEEDEGVSNV